MNFSQLDARTGFSDKAGFTLSPKQISAIEELASYERSANFSEVGSGKTVMSTAVSMLGGAKHTLILVPPVLLEQWGRWLRRFTNSVTVYVGTPAQRVRLDLRVRWVVMSHAIFRIDFDKIYKTYAGAPIELIVDEAQFLKSSGSVLYQKVTKLGVGQRIQLLTGTPTSKPGDAYSYIKIKTPNLYRSYGHFENMHVADRDFFGQVTRWSGLDMIADRLALQTVRFTRKELFGDDIEGIFPDTSYTLDPEHQKLYERLVEEQLLLLSDGTKIDATTAVRLFHAVQQAVVNFDYFSGDSSKRSAAYDILDQTLDEIEIQDTSKSKLIVWTYYKRTTESVLKYLLDKGIDAVAGYSGADSQKSFDRFTGDPNCRVLVAVPRSCGAGLNAQEVCSEALFLETPLIPMEARQSFGRIIRKGQTRVPRIKVATAKGTIQTRLLAMLMSKDDLVAQVERSPDRLRDWLTGRG